MRACDACVSFGWKQPLCLTVRKRNRRGPDLQNILGQSYDHLMIMPKLRPTYDGRLIYQTSYEGRKVFIRYDSLAKS